MREFEILGQKIVISNPEEAELANFALQIVNEQILEMKTQHPNLSQQQTAVLALLNVAGKLVKDRRTMDEYRHELDQRCTALMTEVTQILTKKNGDRTEVV
jgi:cell division protein ZapA (FtsZ GTPase activity inhibitor)